MRIAWNKLACTVALQRDHLINRSTMYSTSTKYLPPARAFAPSKDGVLRRHTSLDYITVNIHSVPIPTPHRHAFSSSLPYRPPCTSACSFPLNWRAKPTTLYPSRSWRIATRAGNDTPILSCTLCCGKSSVVVFITARRGVGKTRLVYGFNLDGERNEGRVVYTVLVLYLLC